MQPIYKNPNTPSTEQVYRVNLILWAAMLMSQLMFVLLLFITKSELFNFYELMSFPNGSIPAIIILAVLGLITFAISFVLKAHLLKSAIKNKQIALVQTAQIWAYALCETTTLFGLLSAFAFDFRWFFIWFVVGISGLLLHFPRRSSFQAASFKGIN